MLGRIVHRLLKLAEDELIMFGFGEFEQIESKYYDLEDWTVEAIKYLEATGMERLGSGMGRIVYLVPAGALKIATSQFGREQNQQEDYMFFKHEDLGVLLPVLNSADDGRWILMPQAKPAAASQLRSWLGVPIEIFGEATNDPEARKHVTSKNAKALLQLVEDEEMVMADVLKPDSWGIWKNRLYLLDYGLAKDIAKRVKKTLY